MDSDSRDKENSGNSQTGLTVTDHELQEAPWLTRLPSGVLTSFNPKNPTDRAGLYRAMMATSLKAMDAANLDLRVVHVTMSPARKTDEVTGTIKQWMRTVITLDDGRQIAFGSLGVVKSLGLYADCFGPPPWTPPAVMRLMSESVGTGHWFTLVAVEPEQVAEPKRKK